MTVVLEAKELTKVYNGVTAVDHLNLEVKEGEIFGFLGPNGSGKTTAILMFMGLTEPTEGSVRVLGFDPVNEPLEVKKRVGYLPEHVGFYYDMTGRENLMYVAKLNGLQREEAQRRIEDALRTVGLAEEGDKLVGAYSRGMRQRLGLAELLIKEPRLVFLDEPTLGLDPDGIVRMLDLIANLSRQRNITVFFSSHLLNQVERISTRVGIMLNGKLVACGTIEELKQTAGVEARSLEDVYQHFFVRASS